MLEADAIDDAHGTPQGRSEGGTRMEGTEQPGPLRASEPRDFVVSTRLTKTQWLAFRASANALGITRSDLQLGLILAFLDGWADALDAEAPQNSASR